MRVCSGLRRSGFALAVSLVACASEEPLPTPNAQVDQAPVTTQAVVEAKQRVVFLGDSLTAGFGLDADQAFPALVETQLRQAGHAVQVVNAGVSGDTTAGGRSRIGWLLRQSPELVVVELGANDGLRGQPISSIESNLREILDQCQEQGAQVLLVGMKVPPNYGSQYAAEFEEIFPRLAEEFGVPLVPFLLEGVGGRSEYNLPDGIHPNAQGHRILAATVFPYVDDLLNNQPEPGTARLGS